jgi:hypothetical protein
MIFILYKKYIYWQIFFQYVSNCFTRKTIIEVIYCQRPLLFCQKFRIRICVKIQTITVEEEIKDQKRQWVRAWCFVKLSPRVTVSSFAQFGTNRTSPACLGLPHLGLVPVTFKHRYLGHTYRTIHQNIRFRSFCFPLFILCQKKNKNEKEVGVELWMWT